MQDLVLALESAIAAASQAPDKAAGRTALSAAEELARRLARAGGDLRPYGATFAALRARLGATSGPVTSVVEVVEAAWSQIEQGLGPAGPEAAKPSTGLLFDH